MKIFLISMGCAKNSVDSERLSGRIISNGHIIVNDPDEAEVGIINTCGFIQDAVKENIDAILDLENLKNSGKLKHIIITGCLVNRYETELKKELPSVDLFTRAESWDEIINFLNSLDKKNNKNKKISSCERVMLTDSTPWSRYLKVGEGCDTFCSYCAIPLIRGRLRSTPVNVLVDEALKLCDEGAKELCLVGQDLTAYGKDLYGEPALKNLINILDKELPDKTWLRLLYMHPDRMTEDLVDFLMNKEKVLRYLDVPIQHIDDEILARMNRKTSGSYIKKIFKYIRAADPLFTLRTTIMTGFPGETDKKFEKILDFLYEFELDRVGAFVYSPEEGTAAAKFADVIDKNIAEKRYSRLMELQAEISQKRGELFINKELEVLLEEINIDDNTGEFEIWGRSYRDAPEVDGQVCVTGREAKYINNLNLGDKITAKINDCVEHDLFGTINLS